MSGFRRCGNTNDTSPAKPEYGGDRCHIETTVFIACAYKHHGCTEIQDFRFAFYMHTLSLIIKTTDETEMIKPVSCGDLFTDNMVKYCLFLCRPACKSFFEIVLIYRSVPDQGFKNEY